MAKVLDWVSLSVNGDQANPLSGNSAAFTYRVIDGDLAKTGTYVPDRHGDQSGRRHRVTGA
jgi:hypothetical protein